MEVEIRNIAGNNANDALVVCTPEKMMPSPFYRQGLKVRRGWLFGLIRMVGVAAKLLT